MRIAGHVSLTAGKLFDVFSEEIVEEVNGDGRGIEHPDMEALIKIALYTTQ